jgi:hypothetical protein
MRPLRIIGIMLLAAVLWAEVDGDSTWSMRWRIFCDSASGYSFRYPYQYFPADQYVGELSRRASSQQGALVTVKETEVNGKKVFTLVEGPKRPDLKAFSVPADQLSAEVKGAALEVIGNALTKQKLKWTAWDYYQKSEGRPQAKSPGAPVGIQAMIGESKDGCGLVVKCGERYSGLVLTGNLSANDNQGIIDSFEVGIVEGKGKKPFQTWRERQFRAGKVLDATGKPVSGERNGDPVSWSSAWEVETAHYHVTSQVSPKRLQEYGIFLEALYKTYCGIYAPSTFPPYKLEVHVFNTQQDFMAASGAHGFPVSDTMGGFFAPHLLSIFVFEEVGKLAGKDYTVEHILAHECSHQFLHVSCNGSDHVPTWLNEGLAVYFESGSFRNGVFMIEPPRDRIAWLKRIYQARKTTLYPLEQYLDHYDEIPGEAYGEVYAMTHFWLFGNCQPNFDECKHTKCGVALFRAYWQALKKKENGTEAFNRIFMSEMIKAKGSREAALKAWEELLVDYVLKNRLK